MHQQIDYAARQRGREWLDGIACRWCGGRDADCEARRAACAEEYFPDEYAARMPAPEASATESGETIAGGVLGVDVGGRGDSTALVRLLVSQQRLYVAHSMELELRAGLDDLGYDQWQADQIVAQARDFKAVLDGPLWVVIDESGPGRTVAADVKTSLKGETGVRVVLVTINGADNPRYLGDVWRVPKEHLMAGLKVALQKPSADEAARLVIGPAGARDKLVRQIDSIEATPTPTGRMRIESRGHDDLALAAALAVHAATRGDAERVTVQSPVRAVVKPGALIPAPAAIPGGLSPSERVAAVVEAVTGHSPPVLPDTVLRGRRTRLGPGDRYRRKLG
jgi:hypothetical protein